MNRSIIINEIVKDMVDKTVYEIFENYEIKPLILEASSQSASYYTGWARTYLLVLVGKRSIESIFGSAVDAASILAGPGLQALEIFLMLTIAACFGNASEEEHNEILKTQYKLYSWVYYFISTIMIGIVTGTTVVKKRKDRNRAPEFDVDIDTDTNLDVSLDRSSNIDNDAESSFDWIDDEDESEEGSERRRGNREKNWFDKSKEKFGKGLEKVGTGIKKLGDLTEKSLRYIGLTSEDLFLKAGRGQLIGQLRNITNYIFIQRDMAQIIDALSTSEASLWIDILTFLVNNMKKMKQDQIELITELLRKGRFDNENNITDVAEMIEEISPDSKALDGIDKFFKAWQADNDMLSFDVPVITSVEGKTTTVHAIISAINSINERITSIEWSSKISGTLISDGVNAMSKVETAMETFIQFFRKNINDEQVDNIMETGVGKIGILEGSVDISDIRAVNVNISGGVKNVDIGKAISSTQKAMDNGIEASLTKSGGVFGKLIYYATKIFTTPTSRNTRRLDRVSQRALSKRGQHIRKSAIKNFVGSTEISDVVKGFKSLTSRLISKFNDDAVRDIEVEIPIRGGGTIKCIFDVVGITPALAGILVLRRVGKIEVNNIDDLLHYVMKGLIKINKESLDNVLNSPKIADVVDEEFITRLKQFSGGNISASELEELVHRLRMQISSVALKKLSKSQTYEMEGIPLDELVPKDSGGLINKQLVKTRFLDAQRAAMSQRSSGTPGVGESEPFAKLQYNKELEHLVDFHNSLVHTIKNVEENTKTIVERSGLIVDLMSIPKYANVIKEELSSNTAAWDAIMEFRAAAFKNKAPKDWVEKVMRLAAKATSAAYDYRSWLLTVTHIIGTTGTLYSMGMGYSSWHPAFLPRTTSQDIRRTSIEMRGNVIVPSDSKPAEASGEDTGKMFDDEIGLDVDLEPSFEIDGD